MLPLGKTVLSNPEEKQFKVDEIKRHKLSDLVDQCREQTTLYMRQEAYDPRYCFEIWRRAVVERDEIAWVACVEQYSGFVRRWLNQRLAHYPPLRFEEDVLLNGVFFNFYRFVGPEKFATFQNLAGILEYLKRCCGTLVIDAWRDYQARALNVPFDPSPSFGDPPELELGPSISVPGETNPEIEIIDKDDREHFWQAVWNKLPDQQDRLLVYLRYILDMPPREIVQLYPQYFSDVNQVYRRIKNLLWRLRNSSDLLG
jgi:hypothetical protein